ncbi:MAG: hypothetical protein LH613_13925 [Chamaesiphon sp.]|nr:hypothetical protein [Chamaesiphon sp.]
MGIILGIFIWSNFPFNAAWILGLWVGINLLGDSWIASRSAIARSATREHVYGEW